MEATGSGRNPEQTAGYATRTKPSSVTLTFSSVIASRALRLLIDAAGERDTHSILTSPPATAFVPGHCPLRASERERESESESEKTAGKSSIVGGKKKVFRNGGEKERRNECSLEEKRKKNMIRSAFEQRMIPIESYVDYYFFSLLLLFCYLEKEKNSGKEKKEMYSLRSMRIIWIELYVVLLFSSLRLKRREGIKKKCFLSVPPREVTVRNSCVKLSANLAQRDTKSRRCSLYENRDVDIMLDSILNALRDSVL